MPSRSVVVARLIFAIPMIALFAWGYSSISSFNMLPWLLIIVWLFVGGTLISLTPGGRDLTAKAEVKRARADHEAIAAVFGGGPVVVRSYSGRNQVEAAEAFAREADYAVSRGYSPVAQSWAEGQPGPGRILALGLYSVVARPNGTLTVTYRLDPSRALVGESE